MMSLAFAFFSVHLIVFFTTTGITEGTLCGQARLSGPLNENGECPTALLPVKTNLSSTIMIECRLEVTMSITYNPRLKIYYTSTGREFILRENYTKNKTDDVMDYVFSITVDAELDRGIIMCGADYQPTQGVGHTYCFTDTAALVVIQDYDSCNPSKSQSTESFPSTGQPTSTNEPQTTFSTRPTWSTATQTTDTTAPTTQISTTLQPSADAEPNVAVNQEVFFPVVGTVILVGILLVLANIIQLWVIIKFVKSRRPASDQVSATNSLKQEDSTTFENSTAQESG